MSLGNPRNEKAGTSLMRLKARNNYIMKLFENIPFMTPEPDVETMSQFPIHDLMSEIATFKNIVDSFDYVCTHLECAGQRKKVRMKRKLFCNRLKHELSTGTFRITANDFRTLDVTDGPKQRTVQAPSVYHRDGCHAIMAPFEKHTYTSLIRNTAASIKGRGMHWLHNIIENDLIENPGLKYYYQCDIYHYYDSINQTIMKQQIRQYTDDPVLLPMLDNFIELLPEGLSKGLRASQCFANLHLNDIDHKMIERTPFYYRYCDDIVIIAKSKNELWEHRNYLVSLLAELELHLKPNEAVRPTSVGIDYLGYVTFTDDSKPKRVVYSRIRKRTKQKFARRIHRVKSRKRRQTLIGSFFGMAAHGDCRHLLKSIITLKEYHKLKHTRKMKEFGNFNVKPTTFNGKKSFKGNSISSSELDRKGIVIIDYEKDMIPRREQDEYTRRLQTASAQGIDAKFVEPPKTKTLISLIHDGRLRKLWTGDYEILQILEQIDEQNGFPFFVGIEIDYSGKHKKINFVPASKLNLNVPSDEEVANILATYNVKLTNN